MPLSKEQKVKNIRMGLVLFLVLIFGQIMVSCSRKPGSEQGRFPSSSGIMGGAGIIGEDGILRGTATVNANGTVSIGTVICGANGICRSSSRP
jgi:hypothetical protein